MGCLGLALCLSEAQLQAYKYGFASEDEAVGYPVAASHLSCQRMDAN